MSEDMIVGRNGYVAKVKFSESLNIGDRVEITPDGKARLARYAIVDLRPCAFWRVE